MLSVRQEEYIFVPVQDSASSARGNAQLRWIERHRIETIHERNIPSPSSCNGNGNEECCCNYLRVPLWCSKVAGARSNLPGRFDGP